MSVEKSWIKHFGIPERKIMEVQEKVPEGQSLLWYCLTQGLVKENDYLDWACARYEIPRIQRDYFTRPLDDQFRAQSFSLFSWTPDCQPLGEWKKNLYVACLQPQENIEIEGYNIIFVASPVSGLSLLWALANNQQIVDPAELTTTTSQGLSAGNSEVTSDKHIDSPQLTHVEASETGLAQATIINEEQSDQISQIDVSNESFDNINNDNVETFGQSAQNELESNQPLDLLAEQEKLEAEKAKQNSETKKEAEVPEGLSAINPSEIDVDTDQPEGLIGSPSIKNQPEDQDSNDQPAPTEEAPVGLKLTDIQPNTKDQSKEAPEKNQQDDGINRNNSEEEDSDQVKEDSPLQSPPPIISEENLNSAPSLSASEEEGTDLEGNNDQQDPVNNLAGTTRPSQNSDEEDLNQMPQDTSNSDSENVESQDLSESTVTRLENPIDETKTNIPLPPSPKSEWDFQEVTAVTSLRSIEATNHTNTLEFTDMYSDDTRPVCTAMTETEIDATPSNFDQAQSFDDVAGTAFKKMAIHFQKSMLLVFHQNQLIPWRWTSKWEYKGAKAPAAIDLTKPSFFRVAFNTLLPYHGYISPSEVNDTFCQDWYNSLKPKHISVLPISINGNVAGIILGVTDNTEILDYKYSLQFMEELASQISKAYQKIKIKEAS